MEKLKEILKQFDTNRNEFKGVWDENAVAACFQPCAKEILSNGYFLINETYIIELGSIELYYHEEEGSIKDPVMYHTNNKGAYSKYYKEKNELPFFEFGSFNFHTSGIDITFEKEKKYRASFLIRSYRVLENKDQLKSDEIEFDTCSTHIFEDMFPKGVLLNDKKKIDIEWVVDEYKRNVAVVPCKRINIAEYTKNSDGKYVKKEISEEKYKLSTDKHLYFKYGKHYYEKETREWGFKQSRLNK